MSTDTEILNVRTSAEARARLDQLADLTGRSPSDLANEAISKFVAHQMPIVLAIRRGMADVEAGRIVPRDEVMRRLRATIERAKNQKR